MLPKIFQYDEDCKDCLCGSYPTNTNCIEHKDCLRYSKMLWRLDKKMKEDLPPVTIAIMIYVLGGVYMQVLKLESSTSFFWVLCIYIFTIFCFLFVRKHRKCNQLVNLT